jgi:hypothetical protein
LFIGYLSNLIPSISYKKERILIIFPRFQEFPNHYNKYICLFILLLYFFSSTNFGLYNPSSHHLCRVKKGIIVGMVAWASHVESKRVLDLMGLGQNKFTHMGVMLRALNQIRDWGISGFLNHGSLEIKLSTINIMIPRVLWPNPTKTLSI